jgi:hypothetical protein
MIKQCLPWNTSTKFILTANGKRFLSMIKQFQNYTKNQNSYQIEYCQVMEIDRITFEKAKSKIEDIPHGE